MGELTRGQRNIAWVEEHCRIPEGKYVGKPVKLRSWQRDEIIRIYDNPARTRTAIISFGRKNAKTSLAAFLLLLHLVGPEAVVNSQLVSTALSRDQAAILMALAAKIVRMSPTLREFVMVRETAKQMYCRELGTIYKALSADAATNYGASPVFSVHDELGQVKGPRSELYEAIETAAGAHENPLSIIISTQAPTDADLLSILIDDAKAGHDPRIIVSLYTAPKDANPFAEATIKAANPAFGDFLNAEEVMKQAADAARMPAREPAFRNLVLNQRVEARSPFISRNVWKANGGKPFESLEGLPVYAGLDLSATTDLTALILAAPVEDRYHVHCRFWLPADGLRDKAAADRVPYDLWHDQGHLDTTPGATVEYEYIAHQLRHIFAELDIRKVAFDRWNWRFLKPWLMQCGFEDFELERFEEFGQGYASMSPALRALETVLLEHKMLHGNHPVLTMCAANAVVQMDPAGNRKLAKDKSAGRIDGMVALAMAVAVANSDEGDDYVSGRLVAL